MGGKLAVTTVVQPPYGDGSTEGFRHFGPDDEDIPDWALAQMGAHCFEGGVHPKPELREGIDGPAASVVAVEPPDREPGTVPKQNGTGSSRDAWVAYADDVDVEVPKGTTRDAIIELIRAAGHPVE